MHSSGSCTAALSSNASFGGILQGANSQLAWAISNSADPLKYAAATLKRWAQEIRMTTMLRHGAPVHRDVYLLSELVHFVNMVEDCPQVMKKFHGEM